MTAPATLVPEAGAAALPDADFILRLDSYEGPIDLLLEQAREQKVDLAQISILALANQYLAFVERARSLRLELAADYLVMAAWLAYLKSRLLLPAPPEDDEPSGEMLAEALTLHLRRLEAVRRAGEWLMALPQLGREVLARGMPEDLGSRPVPVLEVTLYELLSAYGEHRRRHDVSERGLRIEVSRLYSMADALERLTRMLGRVPGWATLSSFLPPPAADPLVARSALAATFCATLELAKSGRIELRQDGGFGPIYLRRKENG